MRTKLILLAVVLAAAGGAGYYFWAGSGPALPPLPAVPDDWTDPSVREVVETKRQAVAAAPRTAAAWGDLGMAFQANARPGEAVTCYRAAAALDAADPRWPYLLAYLLREGDREEALRLFRVALAAPALAEADRACVELTTADLLADMGRGEEADAIARRVFEANPSNSWAAVRVGLTAVDRGDEPLARRALSPLGRDPSARKRASAGLAALHRRAGRTGEADTFAYVSSVFPPDLAWPNPFLTAVNAFRRGQGVLMEAVATAEGQRNYPLALAVARRLADQYPGPRTKLVLGRALVDSDDPAAAVPVLQDALRDDPGLVMAHAYVGIAHFQLAERAEAAGRPATTHYEQAVAALQTAVDKKSDYAPGHFYLARAKMKLKQPDQALRAIRQFVETRPEEWEGHMVLAEILAADGQKAPALAAGEAAVKLANPNDPRAKQFLEKLKASLR